MATEQMLPESMWEVARRPRWIGWLVFALAVAALFAFLGHWQLDRSVESLKPVNTGTEKSRVLSEMTKPQTEFLDKYTGQKVSVTGAFAPNDFRVLSGRINHDKTGYWLVGRFVEGSSGSSTGASLVVGLGWGATAADARSAIADVPIGQPMTLHGRYLPTEAADDGKFVEGQQTVVSVPQLINEWAGFSGDVYNGYLVDGKGWGQLTAIYSPPPIDKATLNWLNVFYAVEWAVFAGFAIFLWYRLVRDAFERELDDAAEEESLAGGSPQGRATADEAVSHLD